MAEILPPRGQNEKSGLVRERSELSAPKSFSYVLEKRVFSFTNALNELGEFFTSTLYAGRDKFRDIERHSLIAILKSFDKTKGPCGGHNIDAVFTREILYKI